MGSVYAVEIGTPKGTASIYTLPAGFHITESTGARREASVVIPYKAGEKDTSDGKRSTGTVTVEGTLYGATAIAIETTAVAILDALYGATDDYYVWHDFVAAGTERYHRVQYLQSHSLTAVEGTAHLWLRLSLTFKQLENITFAV